MTRRPATMINSINQEHFDVWTLHALITMALKGVLKVTSAALVVVCDHSHAGELITWVLTADGSSRYVFKFCICSLAAGRHKTMLCRVVAVWHLVNI